MLTVEKVTKYDDFLKMESYWDDLLQKSQHKLVFLSYDFIRTEWEHIGWELKKKKKQQPFVLVVRNNKEVIGLFPLVKERLTFHGLPLTVIRALGHTYLDRSDMITTESIRETVEQVLRYFDTEDPSWNVLLLHNIVEGSPVVQSMRALYRNNNYLLGIKPGYQSPYVENTIPWKEYVKRRSKNFHARLKNKTNKLTKDIGVITVREYSRPEDTESALDIAFAIDSKSWKAREGTAISSTDNSRKYWRSLTNALSRKGRVKICILWVHDRPIAFEYHVVHAGNVYSLKWSYDREYRQYSPGLLLKMKSMETFWNEGVREIDLLGTSDDFKEQWTDEKRTHSNVYVFNHTLYSRAAYWYLFKIVKVISKLIASGNRMEQPFHLFV